MGQPVQRRNTTARVVDSPVGLIHRSHRRPEIYCHNVDYRIRSRAVQRAATAPSLTDTGLQPTTRSS
jgi:hypothetical protein